jgi:hypothetical protein
LNGLIPKLGLGPFSEDSNGAGVLNMESAKESLLPHGIVSLIVLQVLCRLLLE